MEMFAHDNRLRPHVILQVDFLQEFVGYHFQSVFWPSLNNEKTYDTIKLF